MPSVSGERYRLLVPLPIRVEFPSVTYELRTEDIGARWGSQLQAHGPKGYWLCGAAGSREKLEREIYETGIEQRKATVPELIFRRLVSEKRAEKVAI